MRTVAIILVLLAASAFSPVSAEDKLEPPPLERYLRWGAVRARPGLEFSNIGYDSNILYAQGDQEPVADLTATVSPKLDGLVLFGNRAFLTFQGMFDFTAYLQNGSQNYINFRGKSRITLPLKSKRFGLFSDLNLSNVQQRPVDLEDIRPKRIERLFGLGVIFEPGWRTEIEIGSSRSKILYDDPDFVGPGPSIGDRLDRKVDAWNLEIGYRFQGKSKITLDALVEGIDFENPYVVDDQTLVRDSDEHRLMLGLDFGRKGPLNGWFKLGWDTIDAKEPVLPDLSVWVGEAELAYRLDSQTRIRVMGERLPGFASWGASTYYLLTELGTRVVHYLNRPFGVEGGIRVGRLTFPESTVSLGRVDDLLHYDVGIRIRMMDNSIGRRVEYSVRIGRYHRVSTLPGFNLSKNTFSFGAVLGY